jgi:hypothetical protein
LSSPYPVTSKIERLQQFLYNYKSLSSFLYYSSYKEENGVNEGTKALTNLLEHIDSELRWEFKELYGENHRSTPYTTLYHGILDYFNFYQEFSVSTLDEFTKLGGLSYFDRYYRRRHEMYGKPIEPSVFSKYAIIRLAMTANDFEIFKHFYMNLGAESLIKEMRVSLSCSIAEFFLAHNDKAHSRNIFKLILEIDPNSKRAQNGLSKL